MLIRLRYWTAMLVAGGVALTVAQVADRTTAEVAVGTDRTTAFRAPMPDAVDPTTRTLPDTAPTWSQVVGPGDSLSGLLAQAGLDAAAIRTVTAALGSAFDLQGLQPGHTLALTLASDGAPGRATLEIADGSRIQATFGTTTDVRTLPPQLVTVRRAAEATVGHSIFAALDAAGLPTRFATDLDLILADLVDLNTALTGGEHIRVIWRDNMSGDRVVGDPIIDFAQLDLADGRYEVVWPDDTSRRTYIFKDDALVRTFDQPIAGARLSSAFGPRMHPLHGTMRMHSGLDFATAQGAAVMATQAGTIAFLGDRSGYGTVVEVDHGSGVQTLYAHLSALRGDIRVGQRVIAGEELGRAGSTGTSTAPHLHYEIRVDDTPVSPLADARLRAADPDDRITPAARDTIAAMQGELARLLTARG